MFAAIPYAHAQLSTFMTVLSIKTFTLSSHVSQIACTCDQREKPIAPSWVLLGLCRRNGSSDIDERYYYCALLSNPVPTFNEHFSSRIVSLLVGMES